jgi:cysteinyl-tRNA synthetase
MPQLLVHGWWNLGGAKMSKSAGNVVDPFLLIEKYGADPVRLYLTGAIAAGEDADFSEKRLLTHYNSALANGLGNLVSRTLNMVHRYHGGRLKRVQNQHSTKIASSWLNSVEQGVLTGETFSYSEDFDETPYAKVFSLPKFQVHKAVGLVMETIARCAGDATSGAWNFRSTKVEDGVERKRRALLTDGCRVGEIAGWACRRQAGATVSADRILMFGAA